MPPAAGRFTCFKKIALLGKDFAEIFTRFIFFAFWVKDLEKSLPKLVITAIQVKKFFRFLPKEFAFSKWVKAKQFQQKKTAVISAVLII
ncbi:MAG: hypothetical protein IKS75_06965 [Clostridiales bacterium]|nr:hypothetical protein [Clostridiales bacterium]